MPQRIQLSRRAGWRMPDNTITVARPGKWGNPFRPGSEVQIVTEAGAETVVVPDRAASVALFQRLAAGEVEVPGLDYPFDDVDELRGHDLACWCSLDGACHADTLIALANR